MSSFTPGELRHRGGSHLACGLTVAISEQVNIAAEEAAAGAWLVNADMVAGPTEALRLWLVLTG